MIIEANIITLAASGFLGGIVRALVGITKNQLQYKEDFEFQPSKVFFTVIASGIIGVVAGLLINDDFRLALLAGYAGTDLLESIYKIRTEQGTLG